MGAGAERFPASVRLTGPSAFREVLRSRRRQRGIWCAISACSRPVGGRLGIVVPRRVVPLAVDRNALKRTIRETYRRMACGLSPMDVVVQVHKRPAVRAERAAVRAELMRLLEAVAQ